MKYLAFVATIASILIAGQSSAQAQENENSNGLGRIEGEWSNQSGYNATIKADQFGGWDLTGTAGEGSIVRDSRRGGNIRIDGEHMTCWFRATLLHGEEDMRWRLIHADGEKCQRFEGMFNRLP